MKVRLGFVSNSSSSSFIILIDESVYAGDIEGFAGMFYGNSDAEVYEEHGVTTRQAIECIWHDIHNRRRPTKEDIAELLTYNDSLPDPLDLSEVGTAAIHLSPDKEKRIAVNNSLTELKTELISMLKDGLLSHYDKYPNNFHILVYADEDGRFGAAMEHGNHWRKSFIPVFRISHH